MSKKVIMTIATIVIIAGLILLIVGIKYDVPNRKFTFRTLEEYVAVSPVK